MTAGSEDSAICHLCCAHLHKVVADLLTSKNVVDAAWNDLELYYHLQKYKAVNGSLAERCQTMTRVHFPMQSWRISSADLLMHAPQQCFQNGLASQNFPHFYQKTPWLTFFNADCWLKMHQLHIDPAFLSLDVEEWATNTMFKKVRSISLW